MVLIQAQELLAYSAGMSDTVGCCDSDTVVGCFAFLMRTGQRQLPLAGPGPGNEAMVSLHDKLSSAFMTKSYVRNCTLVAHRQCREMAAIDMHGNALMKLIEIGTMPHIFTCEMAR